MDEIYEFLLATGNVSTNYKYCWYGATETIIQTANWSAQFENWQMYLLYMIPNLLSQAVIMNKYMEKLEQLEE